MHICEIEGTPIISTPWHVFSVKGLIDYSFQQIDQDFPPNRKPVKTYSGVFEITSVYLLG